MNPHQNQIQQFYVNPLSGEDMIDPGAEANELEGIMENIKKQALNIGGLPKKGKNTSICSKS